ncbi:hypothetical protein ARMGADRAFT_1093580, partial [Armillaria gallica]
MSKRKRRNNQPASRDSPPKRARDKKKTAVPGPLRRSTRASRPPKPPDESVNFTDVLHSEPHPDVAAPDDQTEMEAVSGGGSGLLASQLQNEAEDEAADQFTGRVPDRYLHLPVNDATPLDDLCALVQATLHARKGKGPAEEHSEPEQPDDPEGDEIQPADDIMDVDPDDGARHLADIDDDLEDMLGQPLSPPQESFVFVLLYVKHSSRHVLSERFTPSVAEPEYAEIVEHLTRPGAALRRWLEYARREAPVVRYWVGTSYRLCTAFDDFLSAVTFRSLGPVDSPTRGSLTHVPSFPTPTQFQHEMGLDGPMPMYTLYIYPELLTSPQLRRPLPDSDEVDVE